MNQTEELTVHHPVVKRHNRSQCYQKLQFTDGMRIEVLPLQQYANKASKRNVTIAQQMQ